MGTELLSFELPGLCRCEQAQTKGRAPLVDLWKTLPVKISLLLLLLLYYPQGNLLTVQRPLSSLRNTLIVIYRLS